MPARLAPGPGTRTLLRPPHTSRSPPPRTSARLPTLPLPPCPPAPPPLHALQYIQQQQVVAYQPANQLYCVRARYEPKDPTNFAKGISVFNQARSGSVTGAPVGQSSGSATITAFPETRVPKRVSGVAALEGVRPCTTAPR